MEQNKDMLKQHKFLFKSNLQQPFMANYFLNFDWLINKQCLLSGLLLVYQATQYNIPEVATLNNHSSSLAKFNSPICIEIHPNVFSVIYDRMPQK
jgi:hypothetical protein